MAQITEVKVFVASPGDVQAERRQLVSVVDELNRTIGPQIGFRLGLVRWETHAYPGMGRLQRLINRQIGEYDILVGIMWKRFGTPTGVAGSGTEEEFELAYRNWRRHKKPHIMFYFCDARATPRSAEEEEQRRKVLDFRERISKKGLTWNYKNRTRFADAVRPHLARLLNARFTERDLGSFAEKREGRGNRKKYDAAFRALFEAARMTKAYLKALGPSETWGNTEDAALSTAWLQAYNKLSGIGETDLATRCLVKSFGWQDGTLWTKEPYKSMPIDVDVVLAEGFRRYGLEASQG